MLASSGQTPSIFKSCANAYVSKIQPAEFGAAYFLYEKRAYVRTSLENKPIDI